MDSPFKPIYLLADSQLFFHQKGGVFALASVRAVIETKNPKAAYIGASNGDDPNYYTVFEAAMENIGIRTHRMILSLPSEEDSAFLDEADVIVLAGGSVERGWRVFQSSGLGEAIVERYSKGVTLIGVSAGAVQLGMLGCSEEDGSPNDYVETFKLVPYIVSAHDEEHDWEPLKQAVRTVRIAGLAIPAGCGLIYHPDHTIEPLGHSILEFSLVGERIVHNLLFPDASYGIEESSLTC